MTEVIRAYAAYYCFTRRGEIGEIIEKSIDVKFMAPGPEHAVRAAVRFWEGRQRNMPEHLGNLYCIKVASYLIGPIAEDGSLTNPGNFDFFEYKRDTAGLPLADYVEYRCAQLEERMKK